jgi:hypothetical protein
MNLGKFVFAQVFDLVHPQEFRRCVARYGGDYKSQSFSCWSQFLCVGFGQLTFRESLREIEVCLNSRRAQLYHLGWSAPISRSTLADANQRRDWPIYADLAQILIRRARRLYQTEAMVGDVEETVYALDATTIDLCLGLFPWAKFRPTKSAIKLHTVLDLRGSIPTVITITEGKRGDVRILDELLLEAGSFYILDRGYVDFRRLHRFVLAAAFFVTRGKRRLKFNVLQSSSVDKTTGLRCDQMISLSYWQSRQDYPEALRRISYTDPDTGKHLVFLTNNFSQPALVIAALYRRRWQVELFFKWIKQNLRIKHFYGNSDNAVRAQIWIATCVYVLVAIVKKIVKSERTLTTILQILSVNAFEKVPLSELLAKNGAALNDIDSPNQLTFNY